MPRCLYPLYADDLDTVEHPDCFDGTDIPEYCQDAGSEELRAVAPAVAEYGSAATPAAGHHVDARQFSTVIESLMCDFLEDQDYDAPDGDGLD